MSAMTFVSAVFTGRSLFKVRVDQGDIRTSPRIQTIKRSFIFDILWSRMTYLLAMLEVKEYSIRIGVSANPITPQLTVI